MEMGTGKIIYLNGISAAGKTTLTKALQARANEPFYHVSSDVFCSYMAPKKFWDGDETVGLLLNTVKFYSDIGVNAIVDIVHVRQDGDKPDLLHKAVELLHDCPVVFVNVTCPADELRRRKIERGDQEVDKWLPYQLERFYPTGPYDIVVDTHANTPEECADGILALLEHPEKLTAFRELWVQSQGTPASSLRAVGEAVQGL